MVELGGKHLCRVEPLAKKLFRRGPLGIAGNEDLQAVELNANDGANVAVNRLYFVADADLFAFHDLYIVPNGGGVESITPRPVYNADFGRFMPELLTLIGAGALCLAMLISRYQT